MIKFTGRSIYANGTHQAGHNSVGAWRQPQWVFPYLLSVHVYVRACNHVCTCDCRYTHMHSHITYTSKGKVTASTWMDRKTVIVMSTNCQHDAGVPRRQIDGSLFPVPCPASIISYTKFMGGVDCGDKL